MLDWNCEMSAVHYQKHARKDHLWYRCGMITNYSELKVQKNNETLYRNYLAAKHGMFSSVGHSTLWWNDINMRFENNIVMRSEEELEKEQRLVFYFPNVKECNSSADSARHTCITWIWEDTTPRHTTIYCWHDNKSGSHDITITLHPGDSKMTNIYIFF